jgi:hypothetical protein
MLTAPGLVECTRQHGGTKNGTLTVPRGCCALLPSSFEENISSELLSPKAYFRVIYRATSFPGITT